MTAPVQIPALPSTARLAWHLCRHDLARFRALAAAMVGLELLRAGYAEWALHLAPIRQGERIGAAEGEWEVFMLDLVIWGLIWVVTATVVQADHPSDDRAFWRTRPIAPASVALAKLGVFALVLVAAPSLINSMRLAAYGAPLSSHVAATIQIAVTAFGAVVPAWAFAIAMRTLPRFLAVGGALIVFAYTSMFAALAYRLRMGPATFGLGFDLSDWSRSIVLGWLPALALTVVALAVLVAYYHVRRPWAATAAGAALAILPGLLPPPNPATAPPAELAALVAAPLTPPAGLWAGLREPSPVTFLSGRLALPALPRDVSAAVFVDRAQVLVDGQNVAVGGFQQCCLGRGPTAVALSRPVTANDGDGGSEGIATVRAEALPDMFTKPVTLDAEATIVLERHRLVASLPLVNGASFAGEGYLVEIVAARAIPASDAVLRISRFPALSRASLPRLSFFHADAARTRVAESPSPYVSSLRPAATPVREWVQGRRWSGRYQLMLFGGGPEADRRLLIVESRRAGESRAHIVASGAPVARERPRPR
jgi:hypothetical protein